MPCFVRRWLRLVLTALIFIAPLSAWAGTPLELTIIHVNDTHSHLEGVSTSLKLEGEKTYLSLGGMARLSTLLQEVRARSNNTLFLHAGDAVQGTLYFTKFHGKLEMMTLNALGCDAMVLGNHEFDRGPAGAAAIVGWAHFPMLAANMDCAAEPVLKGKTLPYVVKEVAGQNVGIVGIITPEVKVISNVGPNLGFAPASQTARRVIAQLQARGVDKIILLTHQGYDEDLALAKEVAGIDVIVGGHSHTLLGDAQSMGRLGLEPQGAYPTRVNGPGGRPVYVVQAWQWGQVAGLLDLSFDQEGVVTHAEGRALLVMGDNFRRKGAGGKKAALDGQARQELMAKLAANPSARVLPYDKQIVKMIAPYRKGLKELRETVVARVDRDLLHTRQPGRHPSGVDLPQGSLLAPLIARSMLDKVRSTGMRADLSWQNAGGVRSEIMACDLTVAQIYNCLPFANTLWVVEMSGAELDRAVNQAVAKGGGAYPYFAGARLVSQGSQTGAGTVLEVRGGDGAWAPLQPDRTYRVTTSSFVAQGGDGLTEFSEAKGRRYDTGFVDAEVFLEFARQHKHLPPAE